MLPHVIHAIYHAELLPESSRKGIINLIPKKGKDTRELKNLRPITLLNSDYKIIEKMIANRILPIMDYMLINDNQKGFLPGRKITVNIRKIFDLIKFAKEQNIEALVLNLDYAKAFDKISTESILKTLQYYKFSHYLISWTQIIYKDFTVRTQNNGHFSENINIEKSVHQGGPCSCYYFILVIELLANALRENIHIEGISIREMRYILGQYADDMDSTLKASKSCVQNFIKELDKFEACTGLTVNYEKTTMYRIGSLRDSKAEYYTGKPLRWSSGRINVLGIEVCENESEAIEANYKPLLAKIDTIFRSWSKRNLSLEGKINIVNTLVASQFVYKMQVLPKIPAPDGEVY